MDSFEKNVLDFLKHEEKKVLVIKGRWGIGKTHKWNSIINEFAAELVFSNYSYVSLFGIESLKEVQAGVFYNSQDLKELTTGRNIKKRIKQVSKIVKDLPYISKIGAQVSLLESSLISNYLICFDDLERRSSKLQMSSLLGYISGLSEESKSKVVLIFNEDTLSEEDKNDIGLYREKVIDIELGFFPEPDFNIDVVFKGHSCRDLICKLFRSENLDNIRIIEHIKWNIDGLMAYIDGSENVVKDLFVSIIAILTYIHHEPSIKINVGDVKRVFSSNSDRDEYDKSIQKRFSLIGYSYYMEHHAEIISYINHGDLDEIKFKKNIYILNERQKLNKTSSELKEIWELYHGNFITTSEELYERFFDFLNTNIKVINISELRSIMKMLKDLNGDFDEVVWIDKFIENNLDSDNISLLQDMKNLTVNENHIEKISKRESEVSLQGENSLSEVLSKIIRTRGWNSDDSKFLSGYTLDNIYDFLARSDSPDLIQTVGAIIRVLGSVDDSGDIGIFKKNLYEALMKIAARSKVDRLRVSYQLGLEINE